MSFPRYPAYKDSGVEWLGEVPEHWDVLPCRGIVDERNVKNEGAACQDYLSLMANVGIIPYEEKGDVGNKKPEDLGKCKLVRKGDFVINSMNYGIGSYGVSGYDGVCSPVYIVLIPKEEKVRPGFAFRIFEDKTFQSHAQSFGNGILAHRCTIGWDIIKGIGVPVPSSHEQERILQFLDRETAKIDALIAEQQRLIELLQEKRQALISQAVTKGLNPDAPMKDSGVEWLGEVPEHWPVTTIKRVVSTPVTDGPHETPEFLDDGIPFVSAEAVSRGTIDFERIRGFISIDDHNRYSQKYCPRRNDIFMVKSGATTGTSAIVETDIEFNIWSPLAVIRCGPEALPRFVLHFIRSRNFLEAVALGWSFGTQQNIGMGVIENLGIVVPPLEEQRQIISLLECAAGEADLLIVEAERSIVLLQERRSALISAAVTGQIDVRGLVPEASAA
jgi:type I restriction enzyme S subunit